MPTAVSSTSRSHEIYHSLQDAPLQPDQPEAHRWPLRLISLQPGQADSELKCNLEHTSFGRAAGDYEALSYTWGSPNNKTAIHLNGIQFPVTQNLGLALKKLRYAHRPRRLWIDAICINQDDVLERNVQVTRMVEVYRSASRVLLFLGAAPDDLDAAALLIRQLGEIWRNQTHNKALAALLKLAGDTEQAKAWRSLERLFRNGYWKRVWVMQEIAVAQVVHVVCGTCGLEWSWLCDTVQLIRDALMDELRWDDFTRHFDIPIWGAEALLVMRRTYQDADQATDLFGLLEKGRDCRATDNRDKVFGLLSMAVADRSATKPDYTRDLSAVYQDVARYYIDKDRTLWILYHSSDYLRLKDMVVPQNSERQPECDIPNISTWAPDWTGWLGLYYPFYKRSVYSAASDTKAQVRFCGGGEMVSSGVRLDRIHSLFNLLNWTEEGIWPITAKCQILSAQQLRELEDTIAEYLPTKYPERYPSRAAAVDALQRTLVADSFIVDADASSWTRVEDMVALRSTYQKWLLCREIQQYDDIDADTSAYRHTVRHNFCGRKLFVSEQGLLGLSGELARPGDELFVLCGGNVPFVLRERTGATKKGYEIVSDW